MSFILRQIIEREIVSGTLVVATRGPTRWQVPEFNHRKADSCLRQAGVTRSHRDRVRDDSAAEKLNEGVIIEAAIAENQERAPIFDLG